MKNNKSLGQHWLKNRAILDEIARLALPTESAAGTKTLATAPAKTAPAASNPESPNVGLCLEIGPGLGTLTSSLLKRFQKVIAVEFDPELARKLPGSFPGKNLEVINQDILATDLAALTGNEPYCVAGNIPYYITSPIIKKLLDASPRPQKIVLLIQKEVAERIAADAGDQSLLSLTVQNLAEVELGPVVPAAEFTPPPKVDSQVIILTPLPEPQIDPACLDLAKLGFSSPRKKLVANLAAANLQPVNRALANLSKADWREILQENSINPDARAEDLSLWDWETLATYQRTR